MHVVQPEVTKPVMPVAVVFWKRMLNPFMVCEAMLETSNPMGRDLTWSSAGSENFGSGIKKLRAAVMPVGQVGMTIRWRFLFRW